MKHESVFTLSRDFIAEFNRAGRELLNLSDIDKSVTVLKDLVFYNAHICKIEKYVSKLSLVVDAPPQQDSSVFNKMVALLFLRYYFNLLLKIEFYLCRTIEELYRTRAYWIIQKERPFSYALHKSPFKWFDGQKQLYEVEIHIQQINLRIAKMERRLGVFVRNRQSIDIYQTVEQLYAVIINGCKDILTWQGCDEEDEVECTAEVALNFLCKLSFDAQTMESFLKEDFAQHAIPRSIERNWLKYTGAALSIGTIAYLYFTKNERLHKLIENSPFNKPNDHLRESINTYFLLPCKRVLNAMFGYQLAEGEEHTKAIGNMVSFVKNNQHIIKEAKEKGLDKEKITFDAYTYKDVSDAGQKAIDVVFTIKDGTFSLSLGGIIWSLISRTPILPKEIPKQPDDLVLWSKEEVAKRFLPFAYASVNLVDATADIAKMMDLVLKVGTVMLVGSFAHKLFSLTRSVVSWGLSVDTVPLEQALLEMQQFLVETCLKMGESKEKLTDRVYGKLLFLQYKIKVAAGTVFSSADCKRFYNDIALLTADDRKFKQKDKLIDIVKKKYGLKYNKKD